MLWQCNLVIALVFYFFAYIDNFHSYLLCCFSVWNVVLLWADKSPTSIYCWICSITLFEPMQSSQSDFMLNRPLWYLHWLCCSKDYDLEIDPLEKRGRDMGKHCQRHNGPRVLTPWLDLSLQLVCNNFGDYSRYELNTLGLLCLWQCFKYIIPAVCKAQNITL